MATITVEYAGEVFTVDGGVTLDEIIGVVLVANYPQQLSESFDRAGLVVQFIQEQLNEQFARNYRGQELRTMQSNQQKEILQKRKDFEGAFQAVREEKRLQRQAARAASAMIGG